MVLEGQEGHDQDLRSYINSKLAGIKDPQISEVKIQIFEKASGIFLWVVLVVDILRRAYDHGRMNAVRQRLEEIPPKLSDLFKDILLRDRENMDDLFICLQWILFAKRPLSPHELFLAIQAHEETFLPLNAMQPAENSRMVFAEQSMPTENTELASRACGQRVYPPLDDDGQNLVKRFLLSASKGLAEITKSRKSPTVQFIHESVRDFLLKDDGITHLINEMGIALVYRKQDLLKMCCLNYINATVPRLSSRQQELPQAKSAEAIALRRKTSTAFPFLEYAAAFILEHADDSAAEGISQHEFVINFPRRSWIHVNNLFEKHQIRRYTDAAPLMYIYADRGLPSLVHVAVQQGLPISSPDERYSCSITAALQRDNLRVVKAFLSAENDHPQLEDRLRSLFKPRRLPRGDPSVQVLSSLLKNCRVDIVRTLLETRALDVNTTFIPAFPRYHSLLTYAIENKSLGCVRMLLDYGADANTPLHDNYFSPLYRAIRVEDLQIIRWLIDAGANVNHLNSNPSPDFDETPLEVAITHENQAIIEVLLAAGADVELTYGSEPNYPLLDAVRKEREIPVELLLSAGANPNGVVTNKDSREAIRQELPLHAAILRDNSKIVGLLLKHGADPNAVYPKEYKSIPHFEYSDPKLEPNDKVAKHSPLYIAMACCGNEVLSCLVDAGATLNPYDSSNPMQVQSLVFYAFMEDRIEFIKWLLQPGIAGFSHKALSPLHSAIIDNEIRIVEWILRLIGDLTSTVGNGEF
jgi:ankyrin repeat protein